MNIIVDWHFISVGLMAIAGVMMAIVKSVLADAKHRLDEVEDGLADFKLEVANSYAKKEDVAKVQEAVDKLQLYLEHKLDRIEDKLDGKRSERVY